MNIEKSYYSILFYIKFIYQSGENYVFKGFIKVIHAFANEEILAERFAMSAAPRIRIVIEIIDDSDFSRARKKPTSCACGKIIIRGAPAVVDLTEGR